MGAKRSAILGIGIGQESTALAVLQSNCEQQQQQHQHHLHLSSSNNKNNYNYINKMAHFKIVAFFVCAVVLFVLSTKSAEAAIARVKFSNPSYPGKCVLNSNVIMAPGQTGKAPDHLCAGVTCLENGYVEFRTCQAKAPPKGCKQRDFVNTNRNYPECCERSYDCTKHI
ncbi:uncharacterized protein LOC117569124 [Drosophila albomicans]|uniref:Uncharacterized protein LOC117569124 n=1 Tax=Drosophila albomicans TaxID=7291 RepID=A0A6P8WVT3_DROAB|nr:uncharacterized protein LOC117569124 [Drosophila albomicans]